MLQTFDKWRHQISQELAWADLLIKAAGGDEGAYKELVEKEEERRLEHTGNKP